MSLSPQIRQALTYLQEEGGFDSIKDMAREFAANEQITLDAALDKAIDLFDATLDFDRMLNGRFEKLGDFLEQHDGTVIGLALRPMIRLAQRHLLRRWAREGGG